jgi:tyrocidine synthetase-3
MSILSLLSRLEELEINVKLVDQQLKVTAPEGRLTPDLIGELRSKKGEIITLLQKRSKKHLKYTSIEPVEKREYYELSSAQKRLYFLQQLDSRGIFYNMPRCVELDDGLDASRLEETFKRLIQRHEALRTSFEMVDNRPVQKTQDEAAFALEYDPGSPDNFIRPFDLGRAPLLRVALTCTQEKKHLLMIDMHHIISDGVSHHILLNDFLSLFAGNNLPALRIHYKDYSGWQNGRRAREILGQQQAYWLEEFDGDIPVLNIPTDYSRPAVQSFEGEIIHFDLEAEETKALNSLARSGGATLFMVLLAALNIFLSKVCSQQDIVVGTPTAGRNHADLEKIIGIFVNTLALRNYPYGQKTIKAFLKEVRERTFEAFENQDYPFEDLVEKLPLERDMSRNPLFDVMLVLQNISASAQPGARGQIDLAALDKDTAKFDLSLYAMERGSRLCLFFEYCTRLFQRQTIERFIRHFKRVIAAVIESPNQEIGEVEILSPEEREKILFDFNRTGAEFPRHKTIHRLFYEQVERTPGSTAIVGPFQGAESTSITYRALAEKISRLAHLLTAKGIGPDMTVGIMVERSVEMVFAILSILRAGGGYLPIVPDYPRERVKFMLEESDTRLVLTQTSLGDRVGEGYDVIDLTDPRLFGGDRCELAGSAAGAKDLAYVIYTSGSTGKPKGVMVEHRSVVNILWALQREYPFGAADTYLLKTSYIFDVSVAELFGWFLGGGRLAVLEKEGEKDPHKILAAIEQFAVTHINFVPSMFHVFVGIIDSQDVDRLSGLRYIFLAGEALLPELVNSFNRLNTGIILENIYGPTEGTVYSSNYPLGRWDGRGPVLIGRPMQNVRLYILDGEDHVQPIGIAGELCIGGEGVARGYLRRPELTAQTFTPDPFMPGSRMYRTGDLARWLAHGNIEFLGRIDHQVKIRGLRIELEEIESQLLNYKTIEEAVVISKENGGGDKYLCAYLAVRNEIPVSQLRDYLLGHLPEYMVPAYFVFLERIPKTPSGKIDRKMLPEPRLKADGDRIAPRDRVEEKVAEIWAEVLEIEEGIIGIHSNFFALGGHSLKATAVISKIHRELSVRVPITGVFRNPTVEGLARLIATLAEDRYTSIQSAEEKEYYILSSAQGRLFLLQQLDLNGVAYNMTRIFELGRAADRGKLADAFRKLIGRHEGLRTSVLMINGQPRLRIYKPHEIEFKVEYRDLSAHSPEMEGGEVKIKDLVEKVLPLIRAFDLTKAPLFRAALIKIGEQRHMLMVDMHHIISDEVSHRVLKDDFTALYRGEALPPLRLQYKDYVEWQNREPQKQAVREQEAFWLKEFAGEIPDLKLPVDYDRTGRQSFEGNFVNFVIEKEALEELRSFSESGDVTMYMIVLAVLNVFLFKLTNQSDIGIGTVITSRSHAELEDIIGMCNNTLVLRHYPDGDKTFREFLGEVKGRTLAAFANRDYPFEDLVERVVKTRTGERNPLFDVFFAFYSDRESAEGGGLSTVQEEFDFNVSAKFDLALSAVEFNDYLALTFSYRVELFKRETIKRFTGYFQDIVSAVTADTDIYLKDINLGSELGVARTDMILEEKDGFNF